MQLTNEQSEYTMGPIVTPPPQKKQRLTKKRLLIIFSMIVTIVLVGTVILFFGKKSRQSEANTQTNTEQNNNVNVQKQTSTVRLIATGDIIAHDALNARAKTNNSYDYYKFMQNMQPLFDAADVRFCNQATIAGGEEFAVTGYPIFNAPRQLSRDMAKLGCNVVNTGSNHSNDKSQTALESSIATWDSLPNILAVAGANRSEAERQKVRYFEISGIKFAFLSYTTYLNSPNKRPYSVTLFDKDLAKKQLNEANSNADVVIVSMRWGTEYSSGINSAQTSQSQFLADNGADVVLGHGPHVLEPVKKLKGKNNETYVWYSLGNFLNAQEEIEALTSGLAVMDIDKQNKKITSVGFLPIYMHYEWTKAEKAAGNLLARKDFAVYALEDAATLLKRSLHDTSVDEQTQRIRKLLNQYTDVPILTKTDYLNRN